MTDDARMRRDERDMKTARQQTCCSDAARDARQTASTTRAMPRERDARQPAAYNARSRCHPPPLPLFFMARLYATAIPLPPRDAQRSIVYRDCRRQLRMSRHASSHRDTHTRKDVV